MRADQTSASVAVCVRDACASSQSLESWLALDVRGTVRPEMGVRNNDVMLRVRQVCTAKVSLWTHSGSST